MNNETADFLADCDLTRAYHFFRVVLPACTPIKFFRKFGFETLWQTIGFSKCAVIRTANCIVRLLTERNCLVLTLQTNELAPG